MVGAQLAVVALLLVWARPWHALAIVVLVLGQLWMMRRFVAAPVERALWLSGLGVPLFVAGMMVSAFAVRGV
jgi:chlorophyll synthase